MSAADRTRLRRARGAKEWDALVARSPHATAFHSHDWLQDLAGLCGWGFRPLVVEQEGVAIGVVPMLRRGRMPISPSMPVPYVGPLVPREALESTLTALRRWQLRHAHVVAELSFAVGAPTPTSAAGLQLQPQRTYVLDLTHHDVETYARALHRDRQKGLRRAARLGLEHRASRPEDALAVLPHVLTDAYERHEGRSPYPPDVTASWIADRIALSSGSLVAETVLEDGAPIAVLVGVRRDDVVYGWVGGALPSKQATGAGTVVYDALIRRLIAEGVDRLDLVGHVDEGVARFKRTLGAVEAPYLDVRSTLLPSAAERAGRAGWHRLMTRTAS